MGEFGRFKLHMHCLFFKFSFSSFIIFSCSSQQHSAAQKARRSHGGAMGFLTSRVILVECITARSYSFKKTKHQAIKLHNLFMFPRPLSAIQRLQHIVLPIAFFLRLSCGADVHASFFSVALCYLVLYG